MADANTLTAEHERWLREHFSSVAFNRHLGMEITALGRGVCETRLPWRAEWGQQHDYFHGGVLGAMADTTAGHAALTLLEPGRSAITVEYKINYVAPATGTGLICRARVARSGRTLAVMHADVFAVSPPGEALVATAIVTYLNLAPSP